MNELSVKKLCLLLVGMGFTAACGGVTPDGAPPLIWLPFEGDLGNRGTASLDMHAEGDIRSVRLGDSWRDFLSYYTASETRTLHPHRRQLQTISWPIPLAARGARATGCARMQAPVIFTP